MYTETNKAGVRHFLWILLVTAVVATALSYLKFILTSKLLVDIVTVLVFLFIGYLVFTRYCAVFEYSTDGNVLWVVRKIGHRIYRIEIEVKKIKKLTQDKYKANLPKKTINMCACIFSKKRVYYAVYFENNVKKALAFEPTDALIEHMKRGKRTKND